MWVWLVVGQELQLGQRLVLRRGNVLLGGGARCSRKSPDQVKLVEPDRLLRSRSLRFTNDEPVIVISVEAQVNPLQALLILCGGVPYQVEVVVRILKVRLILQDDFLVSLDH